MANIRWNDPSTGEKAQFVAETIEESLFNYSFDSNRVPSLNLHYFCQDYIETYQNVEDKLMKEGNLIPLNEEFKDIIKNSTWLPNGVSHELLKVKESTGHFKDIDNKEIPNTNKHFFDNAIYINSILESKNNYRSLLLKNIETILKQSSFNYEDKKSLYYCVREYLAELINNGINKGHLYNRTHNILFIPVTPTDDIEYVMSFLKKLQPKLAEYNVVFGVTNSVYRELKDVLKGFRKASSKEKKQLCSEYVFANTYKAYDPVTALAIAKYAFSALVSVYNSCLHETELMILDNGIVKKSTKTKYSLINDSLNILKKNQNKKKTDRIKWLNTAVAKELPSKLLSSFELHNTALRISNPQTQLLTLWTITELLIDTNQNQMNKVNYISNSLCSVLNICYYKRKITDLYNTIIHTEGTQGIIKSETRGNNNLEQLAFIIKDNNTLKTQLINILNEHPLALYKLEALSYVFHDKDSIKNDLLRHSKRLRWQIMRIYRYRCLAVHDGNISFQMPSMNSALENLHYYVDELLNYIFLKREQEIFDLDAILTCARVREASIYAILNKNTVPITEQEFKDIIFM